MADIAAGGAQESFDFGRVVGQTFSLIGRNAVLDDELTRANRASAARVGFWTTFAGAIVCLVVSMAVEPLAATQIMPILIGVGAVSAALRFATLEGRGGG